MAKTTIKVGSRHSKTDQEHLDAALTHVLDAGANMPAPPPAPAAQRVAEANAEAATTMGKSVIKPRYAGAKSVNLTELIEEVSDAWYDLFESPEGMMPIAPVEPSPYIVTIYDDHIIICSCEGDYYSVPYTVDAQGVYTFAVQDAWQEVEVSYVPAQEPPEGQESQIAKSLDTLAFYGSEVKALGDGRVGGYGIRFTDEGDLDLTGDRFAPDTYLGRADGDGVDAYFHHAMPIAPGYESLAEHTFAPVKATRKNLGVWVETVLNMADEYERAVYGLAEKSKLNWSSGAPGHLVRRDGHKITRWPVAEYSLTPTPAEPRNRVQPVKSLSVNAELKALLQAVGDTANAVTAPANQSSSEGVNTMPDETKAVAELVTEMKETNALLRKIAGKPEGSVVESKSGFATAVVSDVLKTPYKPMKAGGWGDYLADVMMADRKSNAVVSDRLRLMNDERRSAIKASGSNETVPSEGGWLTQVDHENEFLRLTYASGVLASRCSRRSLGGNFNGTTMYGRDESSRATGSRWGGVQGYRLGEGGTITGSKPQFRKIELKLKKFGVAVYATDELLQDTALLEQEVMASAPNELAFMTDDDIMNGLGVAGPVGYLNGAGALITVAAEAGQAASTIVSNNIFKMWSRRWAANAANYVWLINQEIEPQLYTMSVAVGVGGVPVYLPPTGLSDSPYSTLYGRPVIPTEFNPGLGSAGDIQLVDLSQYKLIDKGGVQSASSIHVQFMTDETVFRFLYRVDGQPMWSKALTPYKTNTSTTFSPFIALGAR